MNIKEVLSFGTKTLFNSGISEPKSSAEVLLADILGFSRTELTTNGEAVVAAKDFKKFQKYLKKRLNHEPVWQIIGKVPFWGMEYSINKNVLVPRPETEILVKEVLGYVKSQNRPLKILDLGTGSGTVIIALASELQNCSFFASDLSASALNISKRNAKSLVPKTNIKFKKGDLLKPWKGENFDIICANLPYIPHEEMASLALEVYHHEPRVALDGGKLGLEIYKEFFSEVGAHLAVNGAIFCEIGINQGAEVQKMAKLYLSGSNCKILGDLAGIDRIAIIKT